MNRSFWAGAGIGAVTTVAVIGAIVGLRGQGELPEVRPGPAAVVQPGGTPSAPQPPEPQLSKLQAECAAARREADQWKRSSEQAQARVVALHHAMAESGVDKEKIDASLKAYQNDPERLRNLTKVGEDLPDDVATALGLNAGQREAVNSLFKQEAREMYGALRAIAAGDPSIAVPAEDGPELFLALNNKFRDSRELYGRVFDALKEIRRRTLAATPGVLDSSQQAKFQELFSGYFGFGGARYYFRE